MRRAIDLAPASTEWKTALGQALLAESNRTNDPKEKVRLLTESSTLATDDAKPRILTNSLSEPDDVESMVAGLALAREIAAQGPLSEIVVKELKPGPGIETREELEADQRELDGDHRGKQAAAGPFILGTEIGQGDAPHRRERRTNVVHRFTVSGGGP